MKNLCVLTTFRDAMRCRDEASEWGDEAAAARSLSKICTQPDGAWPSHMRMIEQVSTYWFPSVFIFVIYLFENHIRKRTDKKKTSSQFHYGNIFIHNISPSFPRSIGLGCS